jgi:hypothetical protein
LSLGFSCCSVHRGLTVGLSGSVLLVVVESDHNGTQRIACASGISAVTIERSRKLRVSKFVSDRLVQADPDDDQQMLPRTVSRKDVSRTRRIPADISTGSISQR